MQAIVELLQSASLLAKTVSAEPEYIDFFLKQLEDPENFRPLKLLSEHHDREFCYDPRDGHWRQRFFSKPREHHLIAERKNIHYKKKFTWSGHPKKSKFTKKTSVTLLPPHCKIQFYQPKPSHKPSQKQAVGFLFNINRCNLKEEKYLFTEMANTDERWWLYNPQKKHLVRRSIPLEALRRQLFNAAKYNQILPPNELLVGLSLDALVGIFSPVDTRESRLQTLVVQQKVRKKFNIDLPMFIITTNGIQVYSERRQREDILEAEITNDPLFHELLIHSDSLLLETKSTSRFPLGNLIEKDSGVSHHIPSFLTLSELAQLSQTNHFMRSLLNDRSSTFLWHNLLSKKLKIPDNLSDKNDIGLYYEKSLSPRLSLTEFARRNPNRAYRVMRSGFFSQQLPSAERRLRSNSRSFFQKAFCSFLGVFIGLGIGLVMTIPLAILAVLRILSFYWVIGKTSFVRSLLGSTFFPPFSLCKSSWYGAMFGWKYGLSQLNYLIAGLKIFHLELYHGTTGNCHDPWTLCTPYEQSIAHIENTDLWKFFDEESGLKPIAEIADEFKAQMPASLMYQAPLILR